MKLKIIVSKLNPTMYEKTKTQYKSRVYFRLQYFDIYLIIIFYFIIFSLLFVAVIF